MEADVVLSKVRMELKGFFVGVVFIESELDKQQAATSLFDETKQWLQDTIRVCQSIPGSASIYEH